MTDVLTEVADRIDAILRLGRGADGALGVDAQARSLVVGHFRKGLDGASLRDPAYPLGSFDRSYSLDWAGFESSEEFNGAAPDFIATYQCTLLLGHLYGAAHAGMLKIIGGEVRATAALQGRQRALGDATRATRALRFGPLHGSDTNPSIIGISLSGAVAIEDLGDRTITSCPLALLLQVSQTGYAL